MSGPRPEQLEVRRAATRFRTDVAGTRTWHSFSFGQHYDPGDVGFGLLVAHNDEWVAAGHGYGPHRHRDVEVVTWVVEGVLEHRHGDGLSRLLGPGSVQALHAGSGVVHSERAAGGAPVRFVQAWLPSADPDTAPSYAVADLSGVLDSEHRVVAARGSATGDVATGAGPGVRLAHPGAALHVLRPVGAATLPGGPAVHVYVARGGVTLDGAGELGEGDVVRATGVGEGWRLAADGPAEVLVWAMTSGR